MLAKNLTYRGHNMFLKLKLLKFKRGLSVILLLLSMLVVVSLQIMVALHVEDSNFQHPELTKPFGTIDITVEKLEILGGGKGPDC